MTTQSYEDAPSEPGVGAPSPFGVQSVFPPDMGATNPELAKEFLAIHRGQMAQREPEISGSLDKMQLNVDSMTKMLDDTVASIRAAKSGRSNLPMMAMGAGMLSGTGNFGSQLGAGFGAMVPTIQRQRETDEGTEMNLAQLGMRKAMLQQAPLEAKLAYMKAMQTGDQAAVRAIEQALIRAQATTGPNSAGARAQAASEKLMQKTIKEAMDTAIKQVGSESTEMYATAEARRAAIAERFKEQIALQRAAGVPIPDDAIKGVVDSLMPSVGTRGALTQPKSYFEAPTSPEAREATLAAGLPEAPSGYIYEAIGPKDRPKHMLDETKNFQKEAKDWDTQSKTSSDILQKLDTAEQILRKNPNVVGHFYGAPNSWLPNRSPDARLLDGLFKGIQLNSVPQGQGAVSDMERRLFELGSPNMNNDAKTNLSLIKIQREIFARDKDRRDFFTQYFNNYRTSDGMVAAWDRYIASPAGSAFVHDDAGNPVANTKRTNWREYFKKERGTGEPQKRAKGGAITLGADYD